MKKIFMLLLTIVTVPAFAYVSASFQYQDNDYPITDEIIKNAYTINSNGTVRDMIYFLPTVILKDKESQQTIFIDLYSNLHRFNISHFYTEEIPDELIQKYDKFVQVSNANIDVTKKIKDSIKNATIINKKYFTTKKNFRLGMSPEEAVSIYGEPAKKIENHDFTKLVWDYYSIIASHKGKIPEGLFNKVAYGFIMEITFRHDKAHFINMHKGIP